MLGSGIIVFEELDNLLNHHFDVFDLKVRSILSINAIEIISVDKALNIVDVVFLTVDFLGLTLGDQKFIENFFVVFVDHTISEDPLTLMNPYTNDLDCLIRRLLVSITYALEDLRDISQVESVVHFGRSRFQLFLDSFENDLRRCNKWSDHISNVSSIATDKCVENFFEDHRDRLWA
jgi:hypothetical protein